MALLYLADHLANDMQGGAEQNDAALLDLLSEAQPVQTLRCRSVTGETIQAWLQRSQNHLLLGNCTQLDTGSKEELKRHHKRYCIIEHDHHYLANRNPSIYPDGIAPKSERNNQTLFKNARAVFCQSSLHEECVRKNTDNISTINLTTNFWPASWLQTMRLLRSQKKENIYAVPISKAQIKNSSGALQWCKEQGLKANPIPSLPYPLFLMTLSRCKGLVFLPQWVESFSRLSMEAALLGLRIHGNDNIGALQEVWIQRYRQEDGTWSIDIFEALMMRQRQALHLVLNELGSNAQNA
jgi:hypothetical protein